MRSLLLSSQLTQYAAAFITSLGCFSIGSAFGWSSPVGSQLQKTNEYFTVNVNEFGWIASIVNLGCMIGCLSIGYLMNTFGRKRAMLLLLVPILIGWGLIIWATNFAMMLTGRLLTGLSGAYSLSTPQYTSEIAEKNIRGTLGILSQVFFMGGILFAYSMGTALNVFGLSIACGVMPIIFAALLFYLPESPFYLINKNDEVAATTSLKWFREKSCSVENEIKDMKADIESRNSQKVSLREGLKRPATVRGLVISVGLMFLAQMCGLNVVIFYAKNIFESAGVTISPDLSSIVLASVKLTSVFAASTIIDKAGRKVLLIISTSTISICLIMLGTFYILKDIDEDNIQNIMWLPLLSLAVYAFALAIGIGTIPFLLVSELFSYDVKGFAAPITITVFYGMSFVLTNVYESVASLIGIGQIFLIFASFAALAVIFVYIFLPETKNKTFTEIQELLGGHKDKKSQNI